MRFEKVDYKSARRIRQNNDLVNELIAFKKSGIHCARIADHNYNNSTTARAAIIQVIRREKLTELDCFERSGECYLVNKLMEGSAK
jgi:hypothetical protein